jgi:N-acetylglucosamine malate deacetylase 1
MAETILVIAPHPDDEAIGCGGTILLHARRGNAVHCAFLTSGELGLKNRPPEEAKRIREAEAVAASEVLGLSSVSFLRLPDWFVGDNVPAAVAALRPVIDRVRPSVIYLPHPRESHPDHQAASAVVQAALAVQPSLSPPPRLLGYEVWTPLCRYDEVEDVTSLMRAKLKALRCYRSQLKVFRYDRAVRGLNAYRGELAAHQRYAEVFQALDPAENGGETP